MIKDAIRTIFFSALAAAIFAAPACATGDLPARSEVPEDRKWKLDDIFASVDEWKDAVDSVEARLPELASYKGRLGEGADVLLNALKLSDEIEKDLERVYIYAHLERDVDSGAPEPNARVDRSRSLASRASDAGSFITPEIISIGQQRIDAMIASAAPGTFDDYDFMLSEIWRSQQHVLSPAEESLLARISEVVSLPRDAYLMLTNADMRFPKIKDESGDEVELSQERYISFLMSRDRRVRKDAFEALYDTYKANISTIGTTFGGMLKVSRFSSTARGFSSDIEQALFGSDIPIAVYDQLVDTVESDLEPLHRYVSLRKKVLGLDELHMYDLYCPLVDDPYKNIPWEEAKAMARDAIAPLGKDYAARFAEGLDGGWIDSAPNRGKQSGAYSWGGYLTHPYILMSYEGDITDVFTLVHEMGHSMHSQLSKEKQPYPKADYTIFCAEVASTLNEELLLTSLLERERDRDRRIFLLGRRLEDIRATLYRQTMFASFERTVHAMASRGEDVGPAVLSKIWHELNEKYFGPDAVIDDRIDIEWARIPHFYRPFYVYQYATGISAAISLARGVIEEGGPAVERYMEYLSSGGSAPSIELLKRAGVDMSGSRPIRDAIDLFKETLDELEALLAR